MAQISPTYLSSLFPNGLPQVSPVGVNTAPYSSSGLASQILQSYNPVLSSAGSQVSTVNPSSLPTIDTSQYGSTPFTQEIVSAMQPVFQQQQQGLTEALANAGIVGGSTTGAVGNLATQQIQQLLGALAPSQLSANQQQLAAQQFNIGNQNAATFGNQNAQNSLLNEVLGLTVPAAVQTSGQGLNAGEYNASALNAGQEFNTTNDLNAAQYDTGTANSLLTQILGMQNSNYQQQAGIQAGLQEGAAGGQTGAFQPTFSQPAPVNFSGLTSGFAQPTHAPQPTPIPNSNSTNWSGQQWA